MDLSAIELNRMQDLRGGRDLLAALFLRHSNTGKVLLSLELAEVKGLLRETPENFKAATTYLTIFWVDSKYDLLLLRRTILWMNQESSTGVVWDACRQAVKYRSCLFPGLIDNNGVLM